MELTLPQPYLEHILQTSIRYATYLDPGYPNSNAVWRIETDESKYIVKLCGHQPEQPSSCFWLGLRELFGCIPANELNAQPTLVAYLQRHSPIAVPQILHVEPFGSPHAPPFVLLEYIPGNAPRARDYFVQQPSMCYQLGQYIGSLHAQQFEMWGNFQQTASFSNHEFMTRFIDTIWKLVQFRWQDDDEVSQELDANLQDAASLPSFSNMALIMLDISPSQFICRNGALSAIIDFESYVRGPRELELVAIELFLGSGDAFRAGYEFMCGAMPQISAVRRIFRFFYYILYNAPPKGLQRWLDAPSLFL